jgi:electron transfer flavoprotein alpha subunit
MSEVLILVDSVDGKVSKSTGELATFAKSIGKVNAVVFDSALVSQLSAYAIDNVIICSGIDISKLASASKFILEKINRPTESKFLRAYLNTGKV